MISSVMNSAQTGPKIQLGSSAEKTKTLKKSYLRREMRASIAKKIHPRMLTKGSMWIHEDEVGGH